MKNLLTIFKKELFSYFETAMGYIYLIVFLLISVGLYITPFFTFPRADMRYFFSILPIMLCVFVPAITMRIWAEERKSNTLEMLLTFPMRSYELVLGKFFASLAFYCLALIGTGTIPLMLVILGSPDLGAIFSAYLGALLLGSFFLSLGIFISGLTRDQIVSFVVSLLFCFGLFLIGTEVFSAYIDGVLPGLGGVLADILGVTKHFDSFGRGVIELGDVLFFCVWTVIFLLLNGMALETRQRRGAGTVFSGAVVMFLIIGLLLNGLITDRSLGRLDLTQGKIYTISEASADILAQLPAPVSLKLYITPKDKMPTEMKRVEQDVSDKLKDLGLAADGQLNYRVIHMEAANVLRDAKQPPEAQDEEESLELSLIEKGVRPFSVQVLREDQSTTQLVYSALGIAYKDKPEVVIPRLVPGNLDQLEYQLINTIYKMVREKAPKVVLVAPVREAAVDPKMAQLYQQLGIPAPGAVDPFEPLQRMLHMEKYDVERIKLTEQEPLPEDFDTLVIIHPNNLTNRQRWEVNRALHAGKSVLLAVQKNSWNYNLQGKSLSIMRQEQFPDVNDLLIHYGITVRDDILMDSNHLPLSVRSSRDSISSLFGGGITLNLPTHIMINQSSMNQDISITSRLANLFYLWGSALNIDQEKVSANQLEVTRLLNTSPNAWTIPARQYLEEIDFKAPVGGGEQLPLAVLVSGQFPDAFAADERPDWPGSKQPTEGEAEAVAEVPPVTPAPGKLILVGCSQFFSEDFLSRSGADFFLNSIDALTLGNELIKIRSKKTIDRTMDKPSATVRSLWKFINLVLVNLLIGIIGFSVAALRRKARNNYLATHK